MSNLCAYFSSPGSRAKCRFATVFSSNLCKGRQFLSCWLEAPYAVNLINLLILMQKSRSFTRRTPKHFKSRYYPRPTRSKTSICSQFIFAGVLFTASRGGGYALPWQPTLRTSKILFTSLSFYYSLILRGIGTAFSQRLLAAPYIPYPPPPYVELSTHALRLSDSAVASPNLGQMSHCDDVKTDWNQSVIITQQYTYKLEKYIKSTQSREQPHQQPYDSRTIWLHRFNKYRTNASTVLRRTKGC